MHSVSAIRPSVVRVKIKNQLKLKVTTFFYKLCKAVSFYITPYRFLTLTGVAVMWITGVSEISLALKLIGLSIGIGLVFYGEMLTIRKEIQEIIAKRKRIITERMKIICTTLKTLESPSCNNEMFDHNELLLNQNFITTQHMNSLKESLLKIDNFKNQVEGHLFLVETNEFLIETNRLLTKVHSFIDEELSARKVDLSVQIDLLAGSCSKS